MKVALSTVGKFHTFDLARQLHARGALAGIYTGYPRFKLKNEGLPAELVHTFPWLKTPYMAMKWRAKLPRSWVSSWEVLMAKTMEHWIAKTLIPCDVFVGLSGSGLKAGLKQQSKGGKYVCDRGSCHIQMQNELLLQEHETWGMPYQGIDNRQIHAELNEYEAADLITIPSTFAYQTFIKKGFSSQKLALLPYGVDLSRFHPEGVPSSQTFDVLFVGGMSLQKGIPYLLQAFGKLSHPKKRLRLIGAISDVLINRMKVLGLWHSQVELVGHVPQHILKEYMSSSHVLVLPSIQDGFGMVMAQAMACGCPVVASENTGACDLFSDGQEGFIVPIRQVDTLTQRLQTLADNPTLRQYMAGNALIRVKTMGGWNTYGDQALAAYQEVVSR